MLDAHCAEATRDQTGGLPGGMIPPLIWDQCPWGLGPQLRGTTMPHFVPRSAAPRSYGHGGASGCVAWLDPTANVAWMLHAYAGAGVPLSVGAGAAFFAGTWLFVRRLFGTRAGRLQAVLAELTDRLATVVTRA